MCSKQNPSKDAQQQYNMKKSNDFPLNLKLNLEKCGVWDPWSRFGPEACSLCSLSGWSINAWRNMWSTLYSITTEGIKPTPFWKYIIKTTSNNTDVKAYTQCCPSLIKHTQTYQKAFILRWHPTVCPLSLSLSGLAPCRFALSKSVANMYKYHSRHKSIWNTNTYPNTTTKLNKSCKNIGTHPSIISSLNVIFSQPISETHQSKKQVTCNIIKTYIMAHHSSSFNQNTKHRH